MLLVVCVVLWQTHALPPRVLLAGIAVGTCDWQCRRTVCLGTSTALLAAFTVALYSKSTWSPPRLSSVATPVSMLICALMAVAGIGDGGAHGSAVMTFIGGVIAGQQGLHFWEDAGGGGGGRGMPRGRLARLRRLVSDHWRLAVIQSGGPVYLLFALLSTRGHGSAAIMAYHFLCTLLYFLMSYVAVRRVRLQKRSWRRYGDVLQELQKEEENNDAVLSLLLPRTVMESVKDTTRSVCFAEEYPVRIFCVLGLNYCLRSGARRLLLAAAFRRALSTSRLHSEP